MKPEKEEMTKKKIEKSIFVGVGIAGYMIIPLFERD